MNEIEFALRNATASGASLGFLLFSLDVNLSEQFISVQDPKDLLSAIT
jgi:hypothetical protein